MKEDWKQFVLFVAMGWILWIKSGPEWSLDPNVLVNGFLFPFGLYIFSGIMMLGTAAVTLIMDGVSKGGSSQYCSESGMISCGVTLAFVAYQYLRFYPS